MPPEDLVQAIVQLARERGERLTTLRLVKFLYLADLYFARDNNGRTLTGWPWAFVHFGPYCNEALRAIDAAALTERISATRYASKYDEKDYFFYEPIHMERPETWRTLPVSVSVSLAAAIRDWADDTPGLLDHVYFHTEPMVEASPGSVLSFASAKWPESAEPLRMRALPGPKIKKAKDAARALAERYRAGMSAAQERDQAAIYDSAYSSALQAMGDGEPPPPESLEGTATLS